MEAHAYAAHIIYRNNPFVTACGDGRGDSEASESVGADIFRRGVCLPSDNKMTEEEQDRVIEIVKRCFG